MFNSTSRLASIVASFALVTVIALPILNAASHIVA
jgi:hypothetical protein